MDFLQSTWPWYLSGPLIGIIAFILYWLGENFGFSSNLRHFCSILGAGKKHAFFDYDWKNYKWSLAFATGTILGGAITVLFLYPENQTIAISTETIASLKNIGITDVNGIVPKQLFSFENLATWQGFTIMIGGGFLVGFGTRYAGGCTSGHAISGLSNFQLPSLIAVVGFFIGGLFATYVLLPLILS